LMSSKDLCARSANSTV